MGCAIARAALIQPNDSTTVLVAISRQTNKIRLFLDLVSDLNTTYIKHRLGMRLYFPRFAVLKVWKFTKKHIHVVQKFIATIGQHIATTGGNVAWVGYFKRHNETPVKKI
jgi:hypothetical protein